MHAWLAAQPQTFLDEGIRKFVKRWTKYIEKQRENIKK